MNGDEMMELLKLPPSPRIGWILNALLEEVLDDPEKNENKALAARAKELNKMTDAELKKLMESAKKKKDEVTTEEESEIKKKFHVT
jgi:hypothetical protein